MTTKTTTRLSSRPRREETEAVTVYTIKEAIDEAVQVFAPADAVCFLGDAYCPLSDLTGWIATLPAAQTALRRYVIGIGNITEHATGKVASHYVPVEMLPPRTHVPTRGDVRVKRSQMTFLLSMQSLAFLQSSTDWDTVWRVRPVALGDDGLEFEDV